MTRVGVSQLFLFHDFDLFISEFTDPAPLKMNQPGQEFSGGSSSRDPRFRRRSGSDRSSAVPPVLLACVVCGRLPRFPASAVLGCQLGHVLCADCRAVGGALLSCPRCGSQEIDTK